MKKVASCNILFEKEKRKEILFLIIYFLLFLILIIGAKEDQQQSINACIEKGIDFNVCHQIHS